MFHIFLPVDDSLIDIFVSQSEEFRNRNDQFLHDAPYPFRNGQFQRILGYEESLVTSSKSFPMVS